MPRNSRSPKSRGIQFSRDIVCIVESNVDDVSGEVLARVTEVSLDEGAFDAIVSPFIGKKGRPGFTVRITCARSAAHKFRDIIVRETGTLGVKITETERWIVKRKERKINVEVLGKTRQIRMKIASMEGQTRLKPENEDAKKLANEFGISLRSVMEIISRQAAQRLEE